MARLPAAQGESLINFRTTSFFFQSRHNSGGACPKPCFSAFIRSDLWRGPSSTALIREETPNLLKMLSTCVFTVACEMQSFSAISRLVIPSDSLASTSNSRAESASGSFAADALWPQRVSAFRRKRASGVDRALFPRRLRGKFLHQGQKRPAVQIKRHINGIPVRVVNRLAQ